ncbi:MAG: EsaB/YukD family protein [Solirubrobacterales bacterium]
MDLTVVDATGNKTEEVSVPETVPAGRIVSKLVQLLQLPATGPDGQPLSYKFHHKQSGRQISDDETLADAGVAENDVLRLVAEITAGSV